MNCEDIIRVKYLNFLNTRWRNEGRERGGGGEGSSVPTGGGRGGRLPPPDEWQAKKKEREKEKEKKEKGGKRREIFVFCLSARILSKMLRATRYVR